VWKIWCKALGQKEGKSNREADAVAVIRTLILLGYMITNSFIVSGVVRHWDASRPASLQDWNSVNTVSCDTELIKK
jgi:hypothetical protein